MKMKETGPRGGRASLAALDIMSYVLDEFHESNSNCIVVVVFVQITKYD